MTGWESLLQFLTVDLLDAGCAETFAMLEQYTERVPTNDAAQCLPDVAAHLRVCSSCSEDLDGLLGLATDLRMP